MAYQDQSEACSQISGVQVKIVTILDKEECFINSFCWRICTQRTHCHKNRLLLMLYLCARSRLSKAKDKLPESILLRCVTTNVLRSLRSKSVTLFRCSTVVRTTFFYMCCTLGPFYLNLCILCSNLSAEYVTCSVSITYCVLNMQTKKIIPGYK